VGWRPRVLFVGAFRAAGADGTRGGQIALCRTLLQSPLSDHVDWVLLDSTQRSLPVPALPVRIALAFGRVWRMILNLHRVDVVLILTAAMPSSLSEKGLMAWIARWAGKRVVVGLLSEVFPGQHTFVARLLRLTIRASDVVWVQGDRARRAVETTGAQAADIIVVPTLIDLRRVKPAKESAIPTILYAGWLVREKGVGELIEAFSQVVRAWPQVRLIVCGGGPTEAEIRARIVALGLADSVELRGWVSDLKLAEVIATAAVLALPSHTEGLPTTLLEAMAAGVPVVATRVGGIPELIADGRTGWLIDVGDVDRLADRLSAMLGEQKARLKMGEAARAHVVEHYDVQRWWPVILRALTGGSNTTNVL